jgi:hypothetical protein
MRLSNLGISTSEGQFEISGDVGDERLWFRTSEPLDAAAAGNAFLAAGLLPAMVLGEPLEVELEVSQRLLKNLDVLQDIFVAWSPFFGRPLRKIPVHAPATTRVTRRMGTATFFSGGVDGWYTLLRHKSTVSHLVFARGIDMQLGNHELFEQARATNAESARRLGKSLVVVDTNIRFLGRAYGLGWNQYIGSGLASLALLLGYQQMFIPASVTYGEPMPWGSHFLTDPLWSTEGTELIYDGANAKRGEKLRLIADCDWARDTLRVCWQDAGYNCGKCEKCLRTMVQLRALGIRSQALPALDDVRALRQLRITDDNGLALALESLALASIANDRRLIAALRRPLRRYGVRKALGDLDQSLTGGITRAGFRWLCRR